MEHDSGVQTYLRAVEADAELNTASICHRTTEAVQPRFAEVRTPWAAGIAEVLAGLGADRLFTHQAQAIDLARAGRHVVVATPTASGKSLTYNLPVLEACLEDRQAGALYLFPLKALAQDQHGVFERLAGFLPEAVRPRAATYDGDTPLSRREEIRRRPPNVILTNPEMLNLSFLGHHRGWGGYLRRLRYVVVDEVHTYRGIMGSHMAWVFRRFLRVCALYGSRPTFVFCSATVANPGELAAKLTGLEVETVAESGAPAGRKHFLFFNPLDGPAKTVIALLRMAAEQDLRTIVYAQSRKMTELIAVWAETRRGRLAGRISAYRSGFLPEERREIEAKLASGELTAVVSTSALELGIDIGGLDVCILAGYPGTVMATLQRGGRVGRSMRESVTALVAGEDALDQYFMRHPDDFFSREPESAVINPDNPVVLARHLLCAAAELILKADDPLLGSAAARRAAERLVETGQMLRRPNGTYVCLTMNPQREIDIRGGGKAMIIRDGRSGRIVGAIDEVRACRETHPGAVYLHRGQTWVVSALDFAVREALAAPAKVDYFTRAMTRKDTEILDIEHTAEVFGTQVSFGRLRVTETVPEFEKRSIRGKRLLAVTPLDLPPQVFETEGFWIAIPEWVREETESRTLHFMGGIHAVEHAAIGILPLLVMADRNDLGGISTPFHVQVNGPAVFVYDGAPGGAGLCRAAFAKADQVLGQTLEAIAACACDGGCPSCVHSPKCGSGNRPIDKEAAIFILRCILHGFPAASQSGVRAVNRPSAPTTVQAAAQPLPPTPSVAPGIASAAVPPLGESPPSQDPAAPQVQDNTAATPRPLRYGVLDLETQRAAAEVGGWANAARMGVACAVLFDSLTGEFLEYLEPDIPRLAEALAGLDLVVGFNIRRFDYKVLSGVSDFDFQSLPTLDILERVQARLGYRLSLDNLARATLGAAKSADGLQAVEWWRQGRIGEIVDYCRQDVSVTLGLYRYGLENGCLLFTNKAGRTARVVADWAGAVCE